jgi:hypothetical protein
MTMANTTETTTTTITTTNAVRTTEKKSTAKTRNTTTTTTTLTTTESNTVKTTVKKTNTAPKQAETAAPNAPSKNLPADGINAATMCEETVMAPRSERDLLAAQDHRASLPTEHGAADRTSMSQRELDPTFGIDETIEAAQTRSFPSFPEGLGEQDEDDLAQERADLNFEKTFDPTLASR